MFRNITKAAHAVLACFSLFAAGQSSGATTLLGVYQPDGSVTWSGDWTLSIGNSFGHDDRVMVDNGDGTFSVQGWAFYSGYYTSTLPPLLQFLTSTEFIGPYYDPPPGFTANWQGDNGWDYGSVFGGVSIVDENVYTAPTLPQLPESIVIPSSDIQLPSHLSFAPGYPGNNYVDHFGNVVRFEPAAVASAPDGGATGIMLGVATAFILAGTGASRNRTARHPVLR